MDFMDKFLVPVASERGTFDERIRMSHCIKTANFSHSPFLDEASEAQNPHHNIRDAQRPHLDFQTSASYYLSSHAITINYTSINRSSYYNSNNDRLIELMGCS